MIAKKLLILTAFVETATGLMLLVSPTLVVAFLLGASLDALALHAALAVWCIACLRSGRRVWTRRHT
jgi:hypothetical protein